MYTGAIGYVRPDGDARFSVAIRTAVVACDTGRLEFGVGSGIVWDSDRAAEYEECLLKASLLVSPPAGFELLATTAWTSDAGFMLIERHLARLRESAEYFGFVFEEARVLSALAEAVEGATTALRVRVLVDEAGRVRVEHQPLTAWGERPMRVALASEPIDPRDPFFFHKTTNRQRYDAARIDGVDDVVLWNPRGEITEATTANVAVELADGIVATPPVECGLLAGTFQRRCARGRTDEGASGDGGRASRGEESVADELRPWRTRSRARRRRKRTMTRFRGASIRGPFALGLCVVATAWTAAQAPGQVARLAEEPAVKAALASARSTEAETIADQIRFCEVAAPPFMETARGEVLRKTFVDLGLEHVRVDRAGNVLGDRPGASAHPHLVVAAHLDTVFPEGTDVRVRRSGAMLRGPGIGDDCRGLAELVAIARLMRDAKLQTPGTITFVANVGEEGLGDLRGMKALFGETLKDQVDRFVSIDSDGIAITSRAVGSRRYRVTFRGPGGHSFAAFGTPNPADAMGRAIAKIAEIRVPSSPRTTFNVGRVGGGTAVNAIPAEAWMEVDLRSADASALGALDEKFQAAVNAGVSEENLRWGRAGVVTAEKTLVGDRPAGRMADDSPIVQTALAAGRALGLNVAMAEGSTDANVPLSLKIPAIAIGAGGRGIDVHAETEAYDTTDAWQGTQNALLLTIALAR